jgi:hypothetical protein
MTNQPNAAPGHTPEEEWTIKEHSPETITNGRYVIARYFPVGIGSHESCANATRSLRCVQAMKDIPDPAAFVAQARENGEQGIKDNIELDRLRQENAQLRTAIANALAGVPNPARFVSLVRDAVQAGAVDEVYLGLLREAMGGKETP